MKKRNIKLILSTLCMVLATTFFMLGVYSLSAGRKVKITGTINFTSSANVTANVYLGHAMGVYELDAGLNEDVLKLENGVVYDEQPYKSINFTNGQGDFSEIEIDTAIGDNSNNIFVFKVEFINNETKLPIKIDFSVTQPVGINLVPFNNSYEVNENNFSGTAFAKPHMEDFDGDYQGIKSIGFMYVSMSEAFPNGKSVNATFTVSKIEADSPEMYQPAGNYENITLGGIAGYKFTLPTPTGEYDFSNTDLIFKDEYNNLPVLEVAFEDGYNHEGNASSFDFPRKLVSMEAVSFNKNTTLPSRYTKKLKELTLPRNLTKLGTFNAMGFVGHLEIPTGVTIIPESAFRNAMFTSVTIPSGVTSIEDYAFMNNHLINVEIPSNVINIGEYSFYNNNLTSVTFPNNVKTIGGSAFTWNQLESLIIPNSVVSIGENAFSINKLISLTFESGINLTIIGTQAFANQLTSVAIPSSVKTIRNHAFDENQLTSVNFEEGLETIEWSAFANNQLTSVTIPNSVIDIDSAFYSNQLTHVDIGTGVTSIKQDAFSGESETGNIYNKIQTLILRNTNVVALESTNAFSSGITSSNPMTVFVPKDLTYDYIWEDNWTVLSFLDEGRVIFEQIPSEGLEYTYIEETNTYKVSRGTFNETDLVIPSIADDGEHGWLKVTEVADSAFDNTFPPYSESITSVIIPNSVTSIGNWAFSNNSLTSFMQPPQHLISIGVEAFMNNQIEDIHLPDELKTIGSSAFHTNRLESVTIPDSVESIGDFAFAHNPIERVEIGKGLEEIKANTFAHDSEEGSKIKIIIINKEEGIVALESSDIFTVEEGKKIAVYVPTASLVAEYQVADNWSTLYSNDEINGKVAFEQMGLTYTYTDKAYTITGTNAELFTGPGLIIPSTHDDLINGMASGRYPVTSIGVAAFYNNQLTSVTIPDSVTSINSSAFESNQLTSVTIPNSVTSIGDHAFFDNHQLTSVVIPSSVTSIGSGAFQNNKLASVVIPNSVTSIGDWAFSRNQLTSVTIPDSVTSIGSGAFAENQLTSVVWETTAQIQSYTFEGSNNKITSFTITSDSLVSLANINAFVGVKSNNPMTVYVQPQLIEDYKIATNWVTLFNEGRVIFEPLPSEGLIYSFDQNTKKYAVIGIGDFSGTDLVIPSMVDYDNNGWYPVTSIGNYAFSSNSLTSVVIPDSVTSIGDGTFAGNSLESVIIGSNVISIGGGAFADNELTSVTIGNNVESIGEYAFAYNSLTSVIIPDSVTSMGEEGTFADNKLTEVTLGSNVTSIGVGAFSGNQLTSVIIPDSVTSIGGHAFQNNSLTYVDIGTGVEIIRESTFGGDETYNQIQTLILRNIDVVTLSSTNDFSNFIQPNNPMTVYVPTASLVAYYQVADYWEELYDADRVIFEPIPSDEGLIYSFSSSTKSYTVIGIGTFSGTDLVIPSMYDGANGLLPVTAVTNNTFNGKGLTDLYIGSNVTSIGTSAFRNNSLTSVIIPDSVTTLGIYAFANNQLISVDIGSGVETIGSWAFFENTIQSLTLRHTNVVTLADTNVFSSGITSSNPMTVYVQPQLIEDYKIATNWVTLFNEGRVIFEPIPSEGLIYLFDQNKYTVTGRGTFSGTDLVIPSMVDYDNNGWYPVTSIEGSAFENNQLTSVTIGNNVTSIGTWAFASNQLTSVTIGNNVTSIGAQAFRSNSLISVTIPDSVISIGAQAFQNNQLTSVVIPDSVTTLGMNTFASNQLKSVTIGNNVTRIYASTFAGNNNKIQTLILRNTSLVTLANINAFSGVTVDQPMTVYVPTAALVTSYQGELNWKALYDENKVIFEQLFEQMGLTYTYANNAYTITGTNTEFTGPGLIIPNTHNNHISQGTNGRHRVKTVGNNAFFKDTSHYTGPKLTSVTIGNNVTTLGTYAFRNNSLISVTIPDSVASIEGYAFDGNSLTSVIIGNSVRVIATQAFANNPLSTIKIGSSVETIGENAFQPSFRHLRAKHGDPIRRKTKPIHLGDSHGKP